MCRRHFLSRMLSVELRRAGDEALIIADRVLGLSSLKPNARTRLCGDVSLFTRRRNTFRAGVL
jgi:hypothetical protein